MNLNKAGFIKGIVILGVSLIMILSLSIFLNFYLSTKIEDRVSKEKITLNTKITFESIKKEYLNNAKTLLSLEKKLNVLNSEKGKLLQYSQIIRSNELSVNYFRKNSPFYKIIQHDGSTNFFYMTNFSLDFDNNGFKRSYTPNLILNIKRSIYSFTQLSEKEKILLQEQSKKISNIIMVDIDSLIKKINKILKTDKSLDIKHTQNTFLSSLKNNKENILKDIIEFTPEVIINLLGITKVLIIGVLGFLSVILVVIIKQLIDSYNKAKIIESLHSCEDYLDNIHIQKHKEMILIANEFYKNRKEDSKDIILETLKASNPK